MAHHTLLLAATLWIASFASPAPPPPEVTVPHLREHSLAEAKKLLEDAGWHGTLTVSPASPGADWRVAMTDVIAGTTIAPDRPLTLVLNAPAGPPRMPDFKHQPRQRVESALYRLGLGKNYTLKVVPATKPNEIDVVTDQSVKPGTLVQKDMQVEITVFGDPAPKRK